MPAKATVSTNESRRDDLPRPTTFFLSEQQHRAVLRVLRGHDKENRSKALCAALGITPRG